MSKSRCHICGDYTDMWTDDCEEVSTDGDRTFTLVHTDCLEKQKQEDGHE